MKNFTKIFIAGLLIASVFVWQNQALASTLIASYPSSNYYFGFGVYSGNNYFGQDFLNSNSGLVLDSASFYISRNSLIITGNAYAVLYAMTGSYGTTGLPTGSALATSNALDVSTLTTSYANITFNFTGANRVSLTSGAYYCIEIYYTGGDTSHLVSAGYGTASLSGDANQSANGTTWLKVAGINTIFSVYGASSGGGTTVINTSGQKMLSGMAW